MMLEWPTIKPFITGAAPLYALAGLAALAYFLVYRMNVLDVTWLANLAATLPMTRCGASSIIHDKLDLSPNRSIMCRAISAWRCRSTNARGEGTAAIVDIGPAREKDGKVKRPAWARHADALVRASPDSYTHPLRAP